jgi:phosphatidylserine/phosphatidylglycerophosphate/cardiolipin synthase-like enzyme
MLFINVKKEPNYDSLDFEDQKKINAQLDKMINYKYQFISYNGLRSSHLNGMTNGGTINPFSNKVIIIDREKVITGSFNFTNDADKRNAENVVLIKDQTLAEQYIQNWKNRYNAN